MKIQADIIYNGADVDRRMICHAVRKGKRNMAYYRKTFNTNTTLRAALSGLRKDYLYNFAGKLGATGISRLNKPQLVDVILDKLLDPEEMFYRTSMLDASAIELFEKGFGVLYEYSDEEADLIFEMNDMDYSCVDASHFYVPDDVVKVWRSIQGEKLDKYRAKASWVWKCLRWTEYMYGITPIELLLEVVNVKQGLDMSGEELNDIFDHFPIDLLGTFKIDEMFVDTDLINEGEDEFVGLMMEQGNKDYYIPSESEIEEMFYTGALISSPYYQKMKVLLMDELGMESDETDDMLCELWDKISWEEKVHDAFQWFWDQIELKDDDQRSRLLSALIELANGTRMRKNCGHTPDEIGRPDYDIDWQPTLVARCSEAADFLKADSSILEKMGFKVNPYINAKDTMIISMPGGINSKMKVIKGKIYPNDPCPCGSGKSFEECCGQADMK